MTQMHGPIGVIDVETTGFSPRYDRVVEIAAVVVDEKGAIAKEYVTLLNPGRDIGPTRIHGITASDVFHAPQFADVAGDIIRMLDGCVAIGGHNVSFDHRFINAEFSRIKVNLPEIVPICTMRLAGRGKLQQCCENHGITHDGDVHSALGDARAAARLLLSVLPSHPDVLHSLCGSKPIPWPMLNGMCKPAVTRTESKQRQSTPPSYLQRLLHHAQVNDKGASDGSLMAYVATLDQILEDRLVSDAEGNLLVELATDWGLSASQVAECHRQYAYQLAVAALADGVVTESERHDLGVVCRLLGCPESQMDASLQEARLKMDMAPHKLARPTVANAGGSMVGLKVCFTGELLSTIGGEPITRDIAERLAQEAGMETCPGVTKKLDMLVVADPNTSSSKATKARSYGIRVLHEQVFWKSIGVTVD